MLKKILAAVSVVLMMALTCALALACAGCSEADKVNANLNKSADYFDCMRHITVYNARTDNIIFEAEGLMSLSNNTFNELVITCKTGPNEYKKNYVYLNAYTMYAVEDITGTTTDPYHYVWYFHTEVLPAIEVKP